MTVVSPQAEEVECPDGHHPYLVRRARGVYGDGVTVSASRSATRYADGGSAIYYGRTIGTSKTLTSLRLEAPAEPAYRSPWLLALIASLILVGLAIFAASLATKTNYYFNGSGGYTAPRTYTDSQYWLAVAVLVGLAVLIMLWAASVAARRRKESARLHPLWDQAMVRWNRAYYCAKCDGVFLDRETALMEPETLFAIEPFGPRLA
jgi:hypothetical protein